MTALGVDDEGVLTGENGNKCHKETNRMTSSAKCPDPPGFTLCQMQVHLIEPFAN